MLIDITDQCFENCSHCMNSCTPQGKHMTKDTFEAVSSFLLKMPTRLIQIAGGEPTLHPDLPMFVEKLHKRCTKAVILIESNGSFIRSAAKTQEVKNILKKQRVHMQVRTHPLYYPNYEFISKNQELKKLPKTDVFDDQIHLLHLGRAKNIEAHDLRRAPSCINVYLTAKQLGLNSTFQALVYTLQENRRFCAPMIDKNGYIRAGEATCCQAIGSVEDYGEALSALVTKEPCNQCNLMQNVSQILGPFHSRHYFPQYHKPNP